MNDQKKSRKPLLVGIIAAVVILAAVLMLLMTQCTGGQDPARSTSGQTVGGETPTYSLYWNLDRAEYDGKSEAGMSSRQPGSDGYFHVRFFIDGETVTLKVADRKTINVIDVNDLMGLEFDENGIIIDAHPVKDMPCELVGNGFYVQSAAKTVIKLNSSPKFDGIQILLDIPDGMPVYDMTGLEGEIGSNILPVAGDRVIAVADLDGKLTHIFVYQRESFMLTEEGYCEHCKETVTWKLYDKTNKLPTSETGHYKLQNDIQLTGQQGLAEDVKLCLDLNGYAVDGGNNQRVIALSSVNTEIAIMDSSEAGTGTIRAHHQTADTKQGILLFVHKGNGYLYSGTLDASDAITDGTGGAAVYVAAGRFFYMNGGEIIGGTAVPQYVAKSSAYKYGNGGSVGVMGKFVLNDGVIRDGVAESVAVVKNGKTSYQRGLGGNIYVGTSGVFEMNGGVIKDGIAGAAGNVFLDGAAEFTMNGGEISGGCAIDPGRQGGNINWLTKATFTMNDGVIRGGWSFADSGNIYTTGTFNMNGGAIFDGYSINSNTWEMKSDKKAVNVYLNSCARMNMSGGLIYGGVYINDVLADKIQTSLYLSGWATIHSSKEDMPNLTIATGKEKVEVAVGYLRDQAKVGVTASGIFSLETDEKNLDNFTSDLPSAKVIYVDKCLAVGKLACMCGAEGDVHIGDCDGTKLVWMPWSNANSLPSAEGNYYLTCDVSLTGAKELGSRDKPISINLDLNGKTVESSDRALIVYGQLNLTDHAGGGQIIGAGKHASLDHSGVILVFTNAEMNIYGGTLKLADKHADIKNGGVMVVGSGAVVNLYNGVIDGRCVNGEGEVQQGGAVRLSGTMNLYGGTVYGGNVTDKGGAIYLADKTAVLNIDGATVYGATAKQAGSIYVNGGSVVMNSGLITGGVAAGDGASDHGGNIFVASGAVFKMNGGVVEGGTALKKNGGNFAVYGTLELSGDAQVLGGSAKAVNSSNIYIQNGKLILSDKAAVSGGVSVVSSTKSGAAVKLSGCVTVADEASGGYLNLGRTGTNPVPVITITGALTDGTQKANIAVKLGNTTTGEFAVGSEYELTDSDKACFAAADTGLHVYLDEDKNSLLLSSEKIAEPEYRCLCKTGDKAWCDHTQELWTPWDGTAQLPGSGNYYLTQNVTDAQLIELKGKTVKIDLNGYTYAARERAFNLKDASVVSIVDTSYSSGVMLGNGRTNKDNGGVFHVLNSTLNLYSGTFALAEGHNPIGKGGVMVVGGNSYVNIYGGTIGNAASTGSVDQGGAINFGGKTLTILGGMVKSNSITSGIGSGINLASGDVVIGGSAVIEDIYLPSGKLLTLDSTFDTSAAKVAVDMEVAGVFAENVADDISCAFSSSNPNNGVAYSGTAKTLYLIEAHSHCWCIGAENAPEHTCASNQEWIPIETGKTPFTATEDGYYYLNWSGMNAKAITIGEGVHAHLCLNGAEIYAGQPIVLKEGSTLSICDCSRDHTGRISVSNSATGSPIRLDGEKTVNLYSGTVTGSDRTKTHAAITVSHASAVLNVYGGKLAAATTANLANGNLTVTAGTVNVLGGTVSKGAEGTYAVTVSGGKFSLGGTVKADGIYLADGQKIVVNEMKEDASVSVAMAVPGVFAEESAITHENKNYISSAMAGYQVSFDGARFALVDSTAPTDCLCGEDPHKAWCTLTSPVAWTETGLPTATGNYYLTAPVTVSETVTVGTGVHIKLWLQGYDITPAEGAALETVFTVEEGGSLALYDTSNDKGTVYANAGMSHVIESSGTLTVNGVTVDASAITAGTANGAAVCVTAGDFQLKDGKIIGGTVSGVHGGAVFVSADGTMVMEDGEISGGSAKYGGNIYVLGTANIKAGTISGGSAEIGGNIGVRDAGILTVTGGKIVDGKFTSRGGNIGIEEAGRVTVSGDVTVSGGGHATTAGKNADRANISLFSASKTGSLTLSDVTLSGGIMVVNSGKNPVVYLSGKVVIEGAATGLILGRTGNNVLATIVVGEAGLTEDASIDLSVNNTASEYVLVDGLTAAQKDAILANENFVLYKDGYQIAEKLNSDGSYDLILKKAE